MKPASATAGQVILIARERIRPFADQPRRYFNQAALKDLARSMSAIGQQVEVAVRPLDGDPKHDFELIDGQRRWHAAAIAEIPKLKAVVRDVGDSEDQFLASVVSNFAREGHTLIETAQAIRRLRKRPEIAALARTEQTQRIADIFGRSMGWVYQIESLLRLIPAAQKLMHPERAETQRMTMQAAILMAQLAPEEQAKLTATINRKSSNTRGMMLLIRRVAADAGAKTGNVPRFAQPSRMRERFLTNIATVADNASKVAELRPLDFIRMFETASSSERESVLYRIELCIKQLSALRYTAARMLDRPAAPAAKERRNYQ